MMARFLFIPIFVSIMVLFQGLGYAQDIRARTENGREVILKNNGTWVFVDAGKSSPDSGSFQKSEKSTSVFTAKGGKVSVWFDPSKWTLTESDKAGKTTFRHVDGDVYALLIYERLGMTLAGLKDIAFKNAKQAAPDAKITYEEKRNVNGKEILCMKIAATFESINFVYYGYYYAGKEGTVQLLTYTSENLFQEYEPAMTEFLNGFVVQD
jgi:hypothetical protein